MGISLKQAVELTKAGKNFDINSIGFDVNEVYSDSEFHSYESENLQNELKTTTNQTLLHIAIESKNIQVFNALLNHGANININVEVIKNSRQRGLQSSAAFFESAEWGAWGEWKQECLIMTTKELAEKMGNQEILDELNMVPINRLQM